MVRIYERRLAIISNVHSTDDINEGIVRDNFTTSNRRRHIKRHKVRCQRPQSVRIPLLYATFQDSYFSAARLFSVENVPETWWVKFGATMKRCRWRPPGRELAQLRLVRPVRPSVSGPDEEGKLVTPIGLSTLDPHINMPIISINSLPEFKEIVR